MSSSAPIESTLFQLVTEEQGDTFYGLFVYDGDVEQPAASTEPTFKLMQLHENWIAFRDDTEVSDCSTCLERAPFVECDADIQFCHLRFPLNRAGTAHAVQTLRDIAPRPSTAFIVAYSASDFDDKESGGMNARTIARFSLHDDVKLEGGGRGGARNKNDDKSREKDNEQSNRLENDAEMADSNKRAIGKWTMIGIVVLGIVALVAGITLVVMRRKRETALTQGKTDKKLNQKQTKTAMRSQKTNTQ